MDRIKAGILVALYTLATVFNWLYQLVLVVAHAARVAARWCLAEWAVFRVWLGPVAGAVARNLNGIELRRVFMLAINGGSVVQVLQYLSVSANLIFIDSKTASWISIAAAGLLAALEAMRRYRQAAKLPLPSLPAIPPAIPTPANGGLPASSTEPYQSRSNGV